MNRPYLFAAVSVFVFCLASCERPATLQRPSKQFVILIDLSASRDGQVRMRDQQFVQKLANGLDYDDEMVLLPMQQDRLSDHEQVGIIKMSSVRRAGYPTSRDRENRDADRQTAFDLVPRYFAMPANGKIQHTDIFATLALAADYVHDSKARSSEILILSDMLQSAQGFEMQHLARMPSLEWVNAQMTNGQLPRISGVCVAIIGEDTTSKDDPKIRAFWTTYFREARAKLRPEDIRPTAPASNDDVCGNTRS